MTTTLHHNKMSSPAPRTVLAMLAALGWLVGCANDAQAPARPVASVTLTPESATVFVAGTLQLSARLRDANGALLTGRPVTWASDHAAVATVDPNGMVQGAGPGSAGVTATSEGASGFATIRVNAHVAAVTVAPAVNTVAVGRAGRGPPARQGAGGGGASPPPPPLAQQKPFPGAGLGPGG